ncbi:hypothetical protein NLI96_g2743 [Meripilus lineatus]|uniref:Glyoxalase-like domain-containing protein n=1 Tax=Meripilus lineatus TaxID=2056292 RepID=A0AAD5V825_9APHY|nr:hypothetical protein NLI96_g2743 [Physisporinus lineatus]
MAETSTRIIDHIVHLSPSGQLAEEIKAWTDLGFNVIPGGTHADGLTENALVAFHDGAYLELISFTHPISDYPEGSPDREKREKHPWGTKHYGFIDFAFLGNSGDPSIAELINRRSGTDGSQVTYLREVPGGRTRKDGEILKWLISAPSGSTSVDGDVRGQLPFFCGDLTPRHLRVPSNARDVEHPNASVGIISIQLLASPKSIHGLSKQLTSVLGVPPESSSDNGETKWPLESPGNFSRKPTILHLRPPATDDESKWLAERGNGVYQVGIRAQHETGQEVKLAHARVTISLE